MDRRPVPGPVPNFTTSGYGMTPALAALCRQYCGAVAVGMDSCNVPGAIYFCKSVRPESLDTCEGGRFSCCIGPDMTMVPCSFDQEKKYGVSLREMRIREAWNSAPFAWFRQIMENACPGCEKAALHGRLPTDAGDRFLHKRQKAERPETVNHN